MSALSREDRGKEGGGKVACMINVFKYLKSCHMEKKLYSYFSAQWLQKGPKG